MDVLDSFISVCRDIISGISCALGTCETKSFNCVLELAFGSEDTDFGALPMPTRCRASYITFFGDNQQLSCTKADTCKLALLASVSERHVCGACPIGHSPQLYTTLCTPTGWWSIFGGAHGASRAIHVQIFFLLVIVLDASGSVGVQRYYRQ